ncbi:MAG: hypothetical protein ABIP77_02655, partial [Candidatus Limnocylindrales bacterium]
LGLGARGCQILVRSVDVNGSESSGFEKRDMNGADSSTDVEHARSVDSFAPNDLDEFSCWGVQFPLTPPGQIALRIEAVVPKPG